MTVETWLPLFGYEGFYDASSYGRIRSIPRNGTSVGGRILKQTNGPAGYLAYCLHANGVHRTHRAHRLIALTFLPNPDNKPHVNHINGDKKDNRIENLEWCTARENINHAYKTGLKVANSMEDHGLNCLDRTQALCIHQLLLDGMNYTSIAGYFKISTGTVGQIAMGRHWIYRINKLETPKGNRFKSRFFDRMLPILSTYVGNLDRFIKSNGRYKYSLL